MYEEETEDKGPAIFFIMSLELRVNIKTFISNNLLTRGGEINNTYCCPCVSCLIIISSFDPNISPGTARNIH